MDISQISHKIQNQILSAGRILVVSHQRPDADAFGSMIALGYWLEAQDKEHHKLAYQPLPDNLGWLTNYRPVFIDAIKETAEYDLLLVLDSSDLAHAKADTLLAGFKTRPVIINIDHHFTNNNFGDYNLVLPDAASTTEVIYRFLRSLGFPLNENIANALLAGLLYDTYNFTNPNTKSQTLEMTSDLLLAGARLNQTSDSLLKTKSLESLVAWGEILKEIKYNQKLGVAVALIRPEGLKTGISENEIFDGIANFLNNLSEVKALLILQQQADGLIKGSLRTNHDLIDVSKLAKILGGGGHQKAAGFRLAGQLARIDDRSWEIL